MLIDYTQVKHFGLQTNALFFFFSQMEIGNNLSLLIDVNGQKLRIEGVTKYTTCDDVIEMVFYNYPVDTDSYALFESLYGVERMLYGKESVLKVVRSWGADQNSFTLLARKVRELSDEDTETEDDHMESFMKTFVDYCDSDEGMGSLDSDAE